MKFYCSLMKNSMAYKFFHKNSLGSGVNNERLLDIAEELYTQIIKKVLKITAYLR